MAGLRHRLASEVHGLSLSGALVTVQRWDGREDRATVIVAVSGRVTQRKTGTVVQCQEQVDRARDALAGRVIPDEAAARAVLVAAGLPGEDMCRRCGERLPVGNWRCAHCGLSIGRSVSGSMATPRRRGDVVIGGPTGGVS